MTGIARIPRRRGSLCGILLVLLGAWGALIPFVGPYFHYAYSPDRAWAYSSGRLYLSILPGIAALLGGLLVLATRSRPVGVLGGFIAAAGGAWLVVGYPVILEITKKTTINPGVPTGAGTSPAVIGIPAIRVFAEELGFFTGLGIVVVFIAAIAIGRFSMLAARDVPAPQPAGRTARPPRPRTPRLPPRSGFRRRAMTRPKSRNRRQRGRHGSRPRGSRLALTRSRCLCGQARSRLGRSKSPSARRRWRSAQLRSRQRSSTRRRRNAVDVTGPVSSRQGQLDHVSEGQEPVAEADGNRTRRRRRAPSTGFEDRGGHQAP